MTTPIKEYLKSMVETGASDLHLKVGSPPILRVNHELVPLGNEIINPERSRELAYELMNPIQSKRFEEQLELDFAYTVPGMGRFRTNIFIQRGSIGIVMRFVKTSIPHFHQLNLPEILGNFSSQERGIVMITGATNSGKSTTLAAMVDYINRHSKKHIISVEDPIEYLHQDRLSIINQREVRIDTLSFHDALKHILRQDPDVIVIGEMRDADSFTAALQAAETGHLVLTTLHASSASNSVDRILDFFRDAESRDQARLQMANNIVAVVCQRLLPIKEGMGLIPAVEIMTGSPVVKKIIHENNLKKLAQAISSGQDANMSSFNQSILKLIQSGLISEEVGLAHATNPEALRMNLQGIFLDDGKKILS
ncbi:MAG: PilT/PilU family type 4a pilus ATPase [Candidatus Aureabacteria bacterium]|nr:PilT/PilU family type 4a pilus ATPase [Candidatus Auribacterota bacterium]